MRTESKKNIYVIVILILIGVLFTMTIKSCNDNKTLANNITDILKYEDSVKTYESKLGKTVEYNKALKVSNKSLQEAKDSLMTYIDSLDIKKPEVIVITKTKTIIDSIPVIKFLTKDGVIDTSFVIDKKYYTIVGNVTNERLKFDSIVVPNKTTLVIGDKKSKWWQKKQYIITVDNSNPYVNNTGLESYVIDKPNKRWSIGPSIGYGLQLNPGSSSITHGIIAGFTVNYGLIKF